MPDRQSKSFLTLGYTGWDFDRLVAFVRRSGGILSDIRFNPWSRIPVWRKRHFEEALGEAYRHVPELGNRRYKAGGPIELADAESGIAILEHIASGATPILMCACADPARCHRHVVAQLLTARGHICKEVPLEPDQLDLFISR